MRLEATSKPDQYHVWMTDDELLKLRRAAATHRDDLVIQFGAFVGLRAFEIPQICPKHVKRVDDEHYRLRVPEGKDTTGSGGKPRDAYLPESVESDLLRYANVEEIDRDESIIDLSDRSVQRRVKKTAEIIADETGDSDWQKVSSHDLRRYYAQTLLVRERMNPRVVMAVGGWSSFEALEPYLNAPTAKVVNNEFEKAGIS